MGLALLLGFVVASRASGQAVPSAPERYRNPAVAGVLSFAIPGAGQAYNGQWGKGLGVLGATVGFAALGGTVNDQARRDFEACKPTVSTPCEEKSGGDVFYFVAVGSWVYGILDAAFTADHLNDEARARVEPARTSDGRGAIALRVSTR